MIATDGRTPGPAVVALVDTAPPCSRKPSVDRWAATRTVLVPATAALLPDPDVDPHRRTDEIEVLAQPALDEPAVPGLQEPAGEQDEGGWPVRGLGGEQHLWLLPAAHRRRRRLDQLTEPGVQPTGGDPAVPGTQGPLHRRREPMNATTGLRRDVDPLGPGDPHQVVRELALDLLAPLGVHQIGLVHRNHQRPAGFDHHGD